MHQAGPIRPGARTQAPNSKQPPDTVEEAAAAICHRINNDLQTLANLAGLASAYAATPAELAQALQDRISALSVCYSAEARKGSSPRLDLAARMVLDRAIAATSPPLETKCLLPPLPLNLKLCSALCLWLFEVIQNACQHGRTAQGPLTLELTGGLDNVGFWLCLRDHGPGMPPEFNLERDARLGLRLARALARTDLRGEMSLESQRPGLKACLSSPAAEFARLSETSWP